MAGIFKAYDVRGIYPQELNEELAEKIGRAYRLLIDDAGRPFGSSVVVSHDMRPHSPGLAEALIRGIRSGGLDVIDIGLATTPMNYFAVGHLKAAGGIQVTASHNPAEYNGLKFSLHEARPVSGDDGIPILERAATSGNLPTSPDQGSVRQESIEAAYAEHVLGHVRRGERPLRVVADAANGMGAIYKDLLEATGIELIPLYFELDGTFPNHEANPLKLENLADLSNLVRKEGADLGICFDGDADRAAFVDEHGEPIGSDLMTALIAGRMLQENPGGMVLYDVRSSRATPSYIEECGGVPARERVGHSFVKATMRKEGALFGGELAGHYYFRENFNADSSILAVIEVLNLLWETGKQMSELVSPLRRFSKSPEINFRVDDKVATMEALAERYAAGEIDRLDGISVDFPDWWFNVRPSNTEPLLRLVVEAESPAALEARTAEITSLLGTPI